MLQVSGLTKTFGSGSNKLQVLKGVDMTIQQGEMVALMGPSGSGKSTLLNIIGGLLSGDGGEIDLDGEKYGQKSPSGVVNIRREYVGWIFQDFHLLENLTALDNVAIALELAGMPAKEAEDAARIALTKVGLEDRMNHIPDQLSGGQQQRVAIARAIAGNRPFLLADEPTGNLDSKSGLQVMKIIQDLNIKHGHTVILVTHERETSNHANRIINIKDGLIIKDEKVKNRIFADNNHELVK